MQHRWAEVRRRHELGFSVKEISKGLKTPLDLIELDLADMREMGIIKPPRREVVLAMRKMGRWTGVR